jgi:hypothetical protein
MDQRSAIAKLCRAQAYPPKSTRLRTMVSCLPPDIFNDILPMCQTPLLAGLLLHLVLSAPMSPREICSLFTSSMIKEMKVMESVRRPCTLSFESFFGDYNDVVYHTVPSNPTVAKYIHECIDQWIDSLTKRILFPKVGSKTVSKLSAQEVYMVDADYQPESDIGITPIDLERVYHTHGVKVTGPCEMRQKWYFSNLKPRTYYAQGGTAYHSSKYLARPFVDLCDTLPSTNKYTRIDPGRLTIRDPTHDIAYYDLTSFTSNLHVQCEFLYRLARYCVGHEVQLLDSVNGVVIADLGDLIYEYTRRNLDNPGYTIPSKYGDSSVVRYHSVAGFLGVYGNISTATFIHGIVMAMRHDNFDENNVAGDDGLDITDSVKDTLDLVGQLGEVEDSKTFRDHEGCCIHLKRPISRTGHSLLHGQLVTWPSLEPVQTNADIRYPYIQGMSNRGRKDAIASSVTAFLRKLEHQTLDSREVDLIDTILSEIYDTYGLPREGCVPQISGNDSGFVPIYERRFIGLDPIYNTISRLYANIARVPHRGLLQWTSDMLGDNTFTCNSNSTLRHLIILGYVEQTKLNEYVFGDKGLTRLLTEYTKPEAQVYEYQVLHRLPKWVTESTF